MPFLIWIYARCTIWHCVVRDLFKVVGSCSLSPQSKMCSIFTWNEDPKGRVYLCFAADYSELHNTLRCHTPLNSLPSHVPFPWFFLDFSPWLPDYANQIDEWISCLNRNTSWHKIDEFDLETSVINGHYLVAFRLRSKCQMVTYTTSIIWGRLILLL